MMWYKKMMLLVLSVRQALSASIDSLENSAESVVFFKTINAPLFDEGTFFLIQSYTLQDNHTVCLNTRGVVKKYDSSGVIEPQNLSWALRGDEFRWCDSIDRMARTPWVIYNADSFYEASSAVTLHFNLSNQTHEVTAKFLINSYSSWGSPRMLWDAKPDPSVWPVPPPPPGPDYAWVRMRDQENANVSISVRFKLEEFKHRVYRNDPSRRHSMIVSALYKTGSFREYLPVIRYHEPLSEFNMKLTVILPSFPTNVTSLDETLCFYFIGLDPYKRIVSTEPSNLIFTIFTLDYVNPINLHQVFRAKTEQLYRDFPSSFLFRYSSGDENVYSVSMEDIVKINEYVDNALVRTWGFTEDFIIRFYAQYGRIKFTLPCQNDSALDRIYKRALSVTLDLSPNTLFNCNWGGDCKRIINRLPAREYFFWSSHYRVIANNHSLIRRSRVFNNPTFLSLTIASFSIKLNFSIAPEKIRLFGVYEDKYNILPSFEEGPGEKVRINFFSHLYSFSSIVTVEYQLCGHWYSFRATVPETLTCGLIPVALYIMLVYKILTSKGVGFVLRMSSGCFNQHDLDALFPRLVYKKTLPGDQYPLRPSSNENLLQQLFEIEEGLFFNVIQFLSFKDAAMTFQFIYGLARSFNTAQFDAYVTDYFKRYLLIDSDKSHPTLYEIISVVEYASDRVRAILFSVLMDEKSCFAVARANELIYSNAVITRRIYLTRLVYGLYLMLGVNLDAEHHYTSETMVVTYLSGLLFFSLDYLKIVSSALPVVRNRYYRKYWVESVPPNATRPVTLRQSLSTNFYARKAHTEILKVLLLNVDPRRRTVLESIRAVQGVSFFTSPHNRSQSRNLAHRTIDVDNSHSSGNDSDLDLSLETPLLQGSMSA